MVQVPATSLWLQCKRLKNGNWNVKLQDPVSLWEKEVWRSIDRLKLERVISGLFSGSTLWFKDASPKAIRAYLKSLILVPHII